MCLNMKFVSRVLSINQIKNSALQMAASFEIRNHQLRERCVVVSRLRQMSVHALSIFINSFIKRKLDASNWLLTGKNGSGKWTNKGRQMTDDGPRARDYVTTSVLFISCSFYLIVNFRLCVLLY